ncbi:MAG: NAD-dependent epimerase/dehydratase family protein [bacterium]
MKVFVAGGTGYIGSHVIDQLLKDGYKVRALVRKGSEYKLMNRDVEFVYGAIDDPASLNNALEGCEAIIYLIGLIREFPSRGISFELAHVQGVRYIYERAKVYGIKRWIHISANGVKPDTKYGYIRTKYRAEEYIKAQDLNYTILRPSVVFGNETDNTVNFVNTIKHTIELVPFFVPIIGNGEYQLQPIHVEDIARVISMIIDKPETFNKTYSLCGQKTLSYNEIVDIITNKFNLKKKMKLHLPVSLLKLSARLFQNYEFFPITIEQINMLIKGNTCSDQYLCEELGIVPKEFY